MNSSPTPKAARYLYMAGLMIAGESIYMLPYMRKTFQTSMAAWGLRSGFNLNNPKPFFESLNLGHISTLNSKKW
jgi:hypothetical protein